jgi:hypothetical protein
LLALETSTLTSKVDDVADVSPVAVALNESPRPLEEKVRPENVATPPTAVALLPAESALADGVRWTVAVLEVALPF